jgi:hypothetical protein
MKLDKESLYLIVFIDASFIGNRDLSSQIRYILVLVDSSRYTNMIY